MTDEDRVVYLLASLPSSYVMLVTALEAQSENVPKWELVTERLRHEELKQKEKTPAADSGRRAFVANQKRGDQKRQLTCHFCKRPGHFKRDCRKFLASQQGKREAACIAEEKNQKATKKPSSQPMPCPPPLEVIGSLIPEPLVTCAMKRKSSASSKVWRLHRR